MKSKTYIVTGSAKAGIGASVTKRILSEGHRVIGTYEQEDKGIASELLKEYGDSNQLQLYVIDLERFLDLFGLLRRQDIA